MSQRHVAGGALFTAVGLGAASAAGWMHAPAWALAIGIAWGALAGELPDIDHRQARVSRPRGWHSVSPARLLATPVRIVGRVIRGLRMSHRGPTLCRWLLRVPRSYRWPHVNAYRLGSLASSALGALSAAAWASAGVWPQGQ